MSIDYEPFVAAADDIAAERGDFAIFVLFLREDMADLVPTSPGDPMGRWDVLMSAAWLAPDHAPLVFVLEKIKKHGGKRALRSIARLRVLPVSDPVVKRIKSELQLPWPVLSGGRAAGRMRVLPPSVIGPGVSQVLAVTAPETATARVARRGSANRLSPV